MPWQRRKFKGNKVFVRVDEAGQLVLDGGRVELRYKLADPRSYRAAPSAVEALSAEEGGAEQWPDEEAVPGIDPATVRKAKTDSGRKTAGGGGDPGPEERHAPLPEEAATAGSPELGGHPADPNQPAAPAASATGRLGKEPIIVYTDGACQGNPGPAGIGVVLMCGSHRKEVSEYLGQGTNNIAELTAIKRALELIRDPSRTVLIHADSTYAIGVLTQGWKAKANPELVRSIRQEMRRFPDLRFVKVEGHAGVTENERCDELAREAITRRPG